MSNIPPVAREWFNEHLDKNRRDGWEPLTDGDMMIPCVWHGSGMRYQGRMICAGCVQEGRITPEQLIDGAPIAPTEADNEFARQRDAIASLEIEKEKLRRERIDFAIERGDVATLESLGAGTKVIADTRAALAARSGSSAVDGGSGTPQAPLLGVQPEPPGERLAVGGAGQAPGPLAQPDPADAVGSGRDHLSPVEQDGGLRVGLEDARGGTGVGAADDGFRVPGVDWP